MSAEVEAGVQRVLAIRRKTNSSGQDGEDAHHIRAALMEALTRRQRPANQPRQADLFETA